MKKKEKPSFMDIQREVAKKHEKYFKELEKYLQIIKKKAKEILGDDMEIYLFGSALEGDWVAGSSDIDVSIVGNIPKTVSGMSKVKTKIFEEIGDFFAPFEFHFATPQEFEIYSGLVKKLKKI